MTKVKLLPCTDPDSSQINSTIYSLQQEIISVISSNCVQ